MTDQRKLFEAAVVERLKESGFLEVEIRVECLARCDHGYQDEVINTGWHYWNAAIAANPSPQSNTTGPQDISTAPKMTDVLVWWPIVQLDEDGEPTEKVVDGRWIISEDQGGYWIEPDVMNAIGDHLGDDFTYAAQPSHWMPLPTPLFVSAEDQP